MTFLDSHCECNVGWLVPLLARISENRKVAIAPVIDTISDDHFGMVPASTTSYGGFTWDFTFTWY